MAPKLGWRANCVTRTNAHTTGWVGLYSIGGLLGGDDPVVLHKQDPVVSREEHSQATTSMMGEREEWDSFVQAVRPGAPQMSRLLFASYRKCSLRVALVW